MNKCLNCSHGEYDPLSDICDNCMCDSDTGWGGFTDHRVNKHFDTIQEQNNYYDDNEEYDDENEYY